MGRKGGSRRSRPNEFGRITSETRRGTDRDSWGDGGDGGDYHRQYNKVSAFHVRGNVLPDSLQIGARVLCRLNTAPGPNRNTHLDNVRPMLVYGIYTDKYGIAGLDLLDLVADRSKLHISQMEFSDPDLLRLMGAPRACKTQTADIYTLPYNGKYFDPNCITGHVPPNLFPEIWVRRVHSLKFNRRAEHYTLDFNVHNSALLREGITLPINLGKDVKWAPDLDGGGFRRKPCDPETSKNVRRAVCLASMSPREREDRGLGSFSLFPPFEEWPDFNEPVPDGKAAAALKPTELKI